MFSLSRHGIVIPLVRFDAFLLFFIYCSAILKSKPQLLGNLMRKSHDDSIVWYSQVSFISSFTLPSTPHCFTATWRSEEHSEEVRRVRARCIQLVWQLRQWWEPLATWNKWDLTVIGFSIFTIVLGKVSRDHDTMWYIVFIN